MVDAFRFAHEHDLEFRLVRVLVDVLSKLSVSGIILYWNVDCNPRLDVNELLGVLSVHSLDGPLDGRSEFFLQRFSFLSEFFFEAFNINAMALLLSSQIFFPLLNFIGVLAKLLK